MTVIQIQKLRRRGRGVSKLPDHLRERLRALVAECGIPNVARRAGVSDLSIAKALADEPIFQRTQRAICTVLG